jgi:hypothetical protein
VLVINLFIAALERCEGDRQGVLGLANGRLASVSQESHVPSTGD